MIAANCHLHYPFVRNGITYPIPDVSYVDDCVFLLFAPAEKLVSAAQQAMTTIRTCFVTLGSLAI